MKEVSFFLAFSAGIVSFLSPCILPLVPAYIGYLTGGTAAGAKANNRFNTVYKSIGFVIGFSIVFIVMGASISSLGKLFAQNQFVFRTIGGLLIIAFGIHTTGIIKIKWLYFESRAVPLEKISSNAGSVFLGMAFAAGWTPCVGPILASILLYAGNMETVGKGVLLLVFYSLGLAIPFILTAIAIGRFSKHIKKVSKYLSLISIISGLLLIVMGILVLTGNMGKLSNLFYFSLS